MSWVWEQFSLVIWLRVSQIRSKSTGFSFLQDEDWTGAEEFLTNLVTWLLTLGSSFFLWLLFISSSYSLFIGHLCVSFWHGRWFSRRSDSREKTRWKSLCLYDLVSKVTLHHVCHFLFFPEVSHWGEFAPLKGRISGVLNMFLTANNSPMHIFQNLATSSRRSALCLRQTLKDLVFKPQENTSEATSLFIDLDLSPLPLSYNQFVTAAFCPWMPCCFSLFQQKPSACLILSTHQEQNTPPKENRWPPSFHLNCCFPIHGISIPLVPIASTVLWCLAKITL